MNTKTATKDAPKQEFTRGSVPESATVSGWHIASLEAGIMVSLPAFMIGAQIGAIFGLARGALAVAIGALFLTIVACLAGAVAQRCRLTTAMIIETAFGRTGAKVVNFVLALTLFGWFGVITKLFGESVGHVATTSGLTGLDPRLWMIGGGSLMIMTTVYGFSALQKVASVVVPFLLMGLVATAYIATRLVSWEALLATPLDAPSLGIGISLVVGGIAAGATIYPDFSRFARARSDAMLAAVVGFAVAMPAVLILSAIPSIATGEHDLTIILASLGLGGPALALLVFSAWTANSGTLYSAALTLSAIFTWVPHVTLTIVAGSIGIALAILGISDYLIPFLTALGIGIPPIAGIYVADFFFVRRQAYLDYGKGGHAALRPLAFASWIVSVAVGAATAKYVFTLSSIPAVDSVVTAFAFYLAMSKLMAGRAVAA